MQYSEGSLGRVFILRFEDGDNLIGSVENMAREKGIGAGIVLFIGALRDGKMVTGPEQPVIPPTSHWENYENAWEVFGMASIFPSAEGPRSMSTPLWEEAGRRLWAACGKMLRFI